MNSFDLVCAVLSNATYQKGREVANITPPPPGAIELEHISDVATGFEATTYSYQGKIIIAYTGTETSQIQDLKSDALLGFGVADSQIKQAALYYEKVKSQYGEGNITLTGHSPSLVSHQV
jgi:type IV secretory pathway TraG/TraD family ATPase VirD4